MSKSECLTHIWSELSSLDELGLLLKQSARLKYTCISASRKYLALGSNTGSVYIFSRDTLKYQQVVYADKKASPVFNVSLSPSDLHVATSVSTGQVNVFELNIDRRCKPEQVRQTHDHSGQTVTCMTWDTAGTKLFVGDDTGKLSIVFVPAGKGGKNPFALPSEVIAYLDVRIFQMDWWSNKLLVSTITHCYLFDTIRHNFSTIGSKKKDGEFGACIFLEPSTQCPVIYCARPKSRMWEVDFEGTVLSTHLFKQLLAVAPVPVVKLMNDAYSPVAGESFGGQAVSFSKMFKMGSLILTWSSKGLYLFNPVNAKVVVWTDSFTGIQDIALYGNDAYLFLEDTTVHRLTLFSIYPLFQLLASRSRWTLMSNLLLASDAINIRPSIVKKVRLDLYDSMVNGLKECGKMETVEKLCVMMDDVSEGSITSLIGEDFLGSNETLMGHTVLPSGMVVVSEGIGLDLDTDLSADKREEFSSQSDSKTSANSDPEKDSVEMTMIYHDGIDVEKKDEEELTVGLYSERVELQQEEVETFKFDEDEGSNENGAFDFRSMSENDGGQTLEEAVEIDLHAINKCSDSTANSWHNPQKKTSVEDMKTEMVNGDGDKSMSEPIETVIDNRDNRDIERSELLGPANDDSCVLENILSSNDEPVNGYHVSLSEVVDDQNSVIEDFVRDKEHCREIKKPVKDASKHEDNADGKVETVSAAPDKKERSSTFNSMPGRFSAVNVKNDESLVVEAVKVPKRRKKKSSSQDKTVLASGRKSFIRSASCGDLAHDMLYQSKEGDGDSISITTISSIEEDEGSDTILKDFSDDKDKMFEGSTPLTNESDVGTLRRVVSFQSALYEQEVVPPLIDRLTAAKGGERPATSEGPLTESGEFVALMSQLPSSLSAMKDGLSMKLKTQTKHFIKTLKDKNRLASRSTVMSGSSPQSEKLGRKKSAPNGLHTDTEEKDMTNEADIQTVKDSLNSSISSPEERAMDAVKDQLTCLYEKAVQIQTAVKNSGLALKPLLFKSTLNEWCREFNAVMYSYLSEKRRLLREESQEEGQNSEQDMSSGGRQMPVSNFDFEEKGEVCLEVQCSVCQNVNKQKSGSECRGGEEDLTEYSSQNVTEQCQYVNEKTNKFCSNCGSSTDMALSLLHLCKSEDPFNLPPHQQQAFHDLCTLCFLCRATGDILNTFHLSERSCRKDVIKFFFPKHLHSIVCSKDSLPGDLLLFLSQEYVLPSFKRERCWCQYVHSNSIFSNKFSGCEINLLSCPQCFNVGVESSPNMVLNSTLTYPTDNTVSSPQNNSHNGNRENHCDVVKLNCLNDKEARDMESAVFLRVFFFFLDYELVKQEVDRRQDNKLLTWASLVAFCHERGRSDIVNTLLLEKQTNGAIDYLRSGILLHKSSLLGHLYSLFQYSPGKTSEFCSEIPKSVSVQEVIGLCLLRDQSPTEPLLRYVKKLIIDVPSHSRVTVFGELCKSQVVRFLLLQGLLPCTVPSADKNSTANAQLSLALKVCSVLPSDWLEQILSQVTSHEEQDVVIYLCLRLGLWKLCVHILSQREDKANLFKLLVSIGSMDLLHESGYIPQTLQEWKVFISCFLEKEITKQKPSALEEKEPTTNISSMSQHKVDDQINGLFPAQIQCSSLGNPHLTNGDSNDAEKKEESNARRDSEALVKSSNTDLSSSATPMTLESVSLLLYRHLGGLTAIELLCGFLGELKGTDEMVLSSDLLHSCVDDFSCQSRQSQVCHEMLEKMSMYMWAKKPGFLPPSLCHAIKLEPEVSRFGSADEDIALQTQLSVLQAAPSENLMSEYLGTHWGQDANIKQTCMSCQLPLKLAVSSDLRGIQIFPCGDAFHKTCCSSPFCPILHSVNFIG